MLFFGISTSSSIWTAVFALALLFSNQVDTREISSKSSGPRSGTGSYTKAAAVETTNWANGNGEPTPARSMTMKSEDNDVKRVCTRFYEEDFDEANDICEDFVAANNCPSGTLKPIGINYYDCCTNC